METERIPCLGCGTRSYTYTFAVYEEGVVCSRTCNDIYEKENKLRQRDTELTSCLSESDAAAQ